MATVFGKKYQFDTFQDPDLFLSSIVPGNYDALLLDVHMPNVSGFALYEKVMSSPGYNGCPIIFISSDYSDSARIKSFELGAVDFMSREVSPDEMLARLNSKILFYQKHRQIIEFDSLKINRTMLKTYVKDNEIPLTFIELKILYLVIKSYPEIVTKENVAEYVWKSSQALDGTVYTHLSNLNSKLQDWTFELRSVKNKGIQLVKKEKQE